MQEKGSLLTDTREHQLKPRAEYASHLKLITFLPSMHLNCKAFNTYLLKEQNKE